MTNSANRRLGANPVSARQVLSPAEYSAGQTSSSVARLEYGNAVERMVGRTIENSPLKYLFKHIGGPNAPDFIGRSIFSGLQFDVTTNTTRSISSHLSRSYGNGLVLLFYERPAYFKVFP